MQYKLCIAYFSVSLRSMKDFIELTIDKTDGVVCYNDKHHVYWDRKDMFTYISVTTLIGMFENYDRDFWLGYKALQEILADKPGIKKFLFNLRRLKAIDIDEVLSIYPGSFTAEEFESKKKEYSDKWNESGKKACEFGTKAHARYENRFKEKDWYQLDWLGFKPTEWFAYIPGFYQFSEKLDRQVFPEMLISMKTESGVRIAGQVDLCLKNRNTIQILDYKTNASIDFQSYRDPYGKYQMMKYPLNELMDCNAIHYQLQTSIYTWILKRKYRLFDTANPKIIHLYNKENTEERKIYELEYIPSAVILMFRYFRDHIHYNYKKVIEHEGRFFISRNA